MSVCDNNITDYYRLSADNRLLLYDSSSEKIWVPNYAPQYATCLPTIRKCQIDYGWAGPIDMTNASPHFGRISPHIYFTQDYSGHEVSHLTGLAGRIIAEAILGNDERFEIFEEVEGAFVICGGRIPQKLSHQDRRTLLQFSIVIVNQKSKGVFNTRLYCFR